MSWLSRFSLAQRALIGLISIVALVFGAIAIPQLKQQLLPTIELPMVSVLAPYQGASPDVVEKQVVEPLENAIKAVDGVEGITSTASEGNAVIMASFDFGDEGTKQLVADIQQAVNRARVQLPDSVDPQVVAGSTDDIPTVVLAVTSDKDQQALADELDRTVVPALEDIEGVGQVSVDGVQELQISVVPDDGKLAAAGLNAGSLSQALQAAGATVPAGSFSESGKSRTIQVGGSFTSLQQIEDLKVVAQNPATGEGGKPVRVGDVATVKQEPATAVSLTRTNGKPSLAVMATMDKDGSAVAISDAVQDKLPGLRKDLGAGAELTVVSDQGPAVSKSISGLTTEGALGLLFAVVVILVFLASIRSTLVTAVSIPLSIVLALIVLWTRDLSLNMLTLGALTIAIGRVVDDSIVVLENIKRHLGYGEERQSAIITAVKEVAGAVTSSTLTTVAVFLPIGLVGGMVGQLFGSFSLTVTAALLASLLVSLTVVPVLSYWFLRPPKGTDTDPDEARRKAEEKEAASRLQRLYVPVLRFATRRRVTSVVIAFAVLFGTFGMVPLLKTNFFDQGEQEVLSVKQELTPGTSLEAADEAARKVEKVLAADKGVEDYQVTVGSSGFLAAFGGGTGANQASYQVTLKDSADFDATQDRIDEALGKLDGIGDTTIAAGDGFGSQDLSVVVKAADADVLKKASEAVRGEVAELEDVTDVQSDLAQSVPRISVKANDKAADAGFDGTTLGAAVAGAVRGTPAGTAIMDDTERDVLVKSAEPATTMTELKALRLGPVRLGDIATVELVPGPVSMTRIDGQRAATITAKPTGDNTGAVSTSLQTKIDALDLPDGATATIGGVSEDQNDAFMKLGLAMLAAIAIVFMLLVATFRSLIQPLILLVSIPFAATGAIGLLVVTGTPMGVPAMIGMLMLIGIVVTNAIVLIDLINQYRAQGMGVVEAVVEGGRHRLRPILMTALATIFALVPMALGVTGEGGFISQPLAVVVIGGLITSTLLTLLLVPTLYAVVELRKERRAEKKAAKREAKSGTGAPETPEEAASEEPEPAKA
ncbi:MULTISPECIES: efflux RND transporter permease subunit [Streptomyces]|uniref:Acriflavin resistance protein n=1 Tax=Streptomyces pratensis (strain ATCC 33331 / IAF-45CD) TaxID=591167 RepID=A0A8D3WJ15_STRFA|nr:MULTISPECIES: efflux RND transporter permease subunit [Streptomyces]MDF9872841.1 HAE1 family hydrophobic/amphiphilic exporter-1 [Streptomyces pratensis]AGJ54518.1 RND multidrug efflux transporter; Acriflavin resistance protein [Streptomyces sp. PAMC 26508]MCY1651144.1 efflux RND transporter permease subunit [Streptomyces sp. SL203]MCY1681694.1 efflux RND transporter permease subunit [Streptomyces sp. SL294]MYT53436.1 MMPL family transporter [Streptomyces sp. SID7815]